MLEGIPGLLQGQQSTQGRQHHDKPPHTVAVSGSCREEILPRIFFERHEINICFPTLGSPSLRQRFDHREGHRYHVRRDPGSQQPVRLHGTRGNAFSPVEIVDVLRTKTYGIFPMLQITFLEFFEVVLGCGEVKCQQVRGFYL